ncbi:MAG: LL-diaminopimelate aminotransferase [Lentisphaeria bacterium]|nr:LL-diaminopimelate aminotransferase [Lentisphaeria bacterium]
MSESFLQEQFAERIGGNRFGKDDTIYKFEKIKRAKRAAIEANPGVELIDMGVGEPDEPAFPIVVETLKEEAGKAENRFYTDNGIAEFKSAAQRYMEKQYSVSLDADKHINHSIGSKSALSLIPAAFINPGDICIMTTPGYPVLGTWSKYLGGEVVNLPLLKENNFFPDLTTLTDDQRKRAKLLYLNYPNNPTGANATAEQYKTAVDFCLENEILIVSDAPYSPLNFVSKPLSILSVPGAMDCAVELHSMSKGFNMTGWRLGWVCGNELAVSAFASVKDNADSGQFAAIQLAAAKALDAADEITPAINEKYSRRLSALAESLRGFGFDADKPQGSFFLYVGIPKGIKGGRSFESGEDFSQWMITDKLISTVPWDDAGHYVRFSATFVAKDLEDEKRVLNEIASRLSDVEFEF